MRAKDFNIQPVPSYTSSSLAAKATRALSLKDLRVVGRSQARKDVVQIRVSVSNDDSTT